MSSRALRRLQREEEKRNRLAQLQENQESSEGDSDSGGVQTSYVTTAKVNAFDMLNATDENAGGEGATYGSHGSAMSSDADEPSPDKQQAALISAETNPQSQSQAKKKKKPKKKKKKPQKTQPEEAQSLRPEAKTDKVDLDEIDLALLSLKGNNPESNSQNDGDHKPSKELLRLYTLLATNAKSLSSLNEMKKLFGNVVIEEENQEPGPAPGRRRNRLPNAADLGGMLAARNSPASRGKGLAGLALRRNVFMAGKESWPKATSGGLSMEVVEKPWDMTIEYGWVHNRSYQDVQRQFYTCVNSLDPERVVQLLQYNPYHISTLLVVSDISEQQGDHTLSGELLERALFSFGRSVHSTFPASIAEGKARMDFRLSENREFWMLAWRYINHLGQRGTWRTAYEWAKLLLSLDPEGDPYCLRLILDQLALRGGQSENFVEMASLLDSLFSWGRDSPNIQISLGLAQYRLKRAELCRTVLRSAVKKFPWVFLRLFQELNIQSTPKAIWGNLPQSDHDKLEMEAYVTRAKDLWNTPESISLLVEVAESVEDVVLLKGPDVPISRNEARHIMLSGIPSLISLLPREYTTAPSLSIDVLPPFNSYNTYEFTDSDVEDSGDDEDAPEPRPASAPASTTPPREGGVTRQERDEEVMDLTGVQRIFARLLPFWANRGATPNAMPEGHTAEEFQEAVNLAGITPDEFEQRTRRLFELTERYRAQQEEIEGEEDNEEEEMPALEPPSDDNDSDDNSSNSITAHRDPVRETEIQAERAAMEAALLRQGGVLREDIAAREAEAAAWGAATAREGVASGEAIAAREAAAAEEDRRRTELLDPREDRAMHELNRRLQEATAMLGPHTTVGPPQGALRPLGSSAPDNPLDSVTTLPPAVPSGSQTAPGPITAPPIRYSIIQLARHNLNLQVRSDFLDPNEPYDEEANKRWLAGRGVRFVEAFTARYGTDELDWMRMRECSYNNPVMEYSKRLKLLNEATRNHFLNYVLRQQVDPDSADLVKRFVEIQDVQGTPASGYREGHKF
ncbi:hypothetical protein MMC30_001686 [Trapelia coarctata]|nr:hypothetical protein [Trapelia coarctata]